jgi:2-polyprenyl-3-methyl-5-hydroxy-6-metoxy-1,4-benzoquinol methylase
MSSAETTSTYHGNPRREMQAFVPVSARRILDIGCGAGVFGGLLKEARGPEHAPEIWGVEMDPRAAALAESRLDRVLCGDVFTVLSQLEGQRFDAVVMNDVLEHLADPQELLRALPALLSEGGCLVASIPNVRYFFNVMGLAWHGRWEYTDEGILDRTHLRFFTRSSICLLLEECGFRVENLRGINPTGSLKFKLANAATLGRFSDMRYLQFAVVARPSDGK